MSGHTHDPADRPPADPTLLRAPGPPGARPQADAQPWSDSPPETNQPGSGQQPVAPPTVFGQPGVSGQPFEQQAGTGQQPLWQRPAAGQSGSGQHPLAPPTVIGQPGTGQQPYAPPGTGQQAYGPQGTGQHPYMPPPPRMGQDPYAPQSGSAHPYPSQPGIGQQPYGLGQQPLAPQPGYGQPPYGYSAAPQPYSATPRRSGGAGAIIAAVAVVVVLVIGVAVAVAVSAGSSEKTSAASGTTTTKAGPLTGTSTAPLTPGSKGVLIPAYRVAYDVPAGWTIHADSDPMSFSTAAGTISGRGQATEGADYCPGSVYRAMAAVTSTSETDLASAAATVAKISAGGGYSDPTGGQMSSPTLMKTQSGVSGQFVETSGPWTPMAAGCTANAYSVYSFGFANAAGTTLVLTILVDRGTTGELTADQAKQLINSLRLV